MTQTGSGTAATLYYYDTRGNQTLRDAPGTANDRTIRYSLDDKPHEIAMGNGTRVRFWYGPDGQRYRKEVGGVVKLYLGNVEVLIEGGVTTFRRYVGGVVMQTLSAGVAPTTKYLFHDQLGSLVRVANSDGSVAEGLDYAAFGQRSSYSDPHAAGAGPSTTPRGYTGHEMLDGTGVIHMNGRIYDADLGRFLQADPLIQAPDNAQSWNAYTYVFNNPLRYTDPTGMLGQEERMWAAAIVALAAAVWTGGASMGWWAAGMTTTQMVAIAAVAGFASGAIATKSWQGGLMGAFTAVATAGLGGPGGGFEAWAVQTFAGGVVGSLQGGDFGHAFVSAGVTAAFAPAVGRISNDAGRIAVNALVGGTISKLTGGKFANGAVSGAVQAAVTNPRDVKYNEDDGALPMPQEGETPESRKYIFDRIVENRELYGITVPAGYKIAFDDRYMSLVNRQPQFCTNSCDDQISKYGVVFGQHNRRTKEITIFRAGVQPYMVSGIRHFNGGAQIFARPGLKTGFETMVKTLGHEAAHARGVDLDRDGAAYHPNAEQAEMYSVDRYRALFNNVSGGR